MKGAGTQRTAAVGGSVQGLAEGPWKLDLKGSAWTTRVKVAGDGGRFAGHTARVHRLGAEAQGAREWSLSGALHLAPPSGRGWSLRLAPSYGGAGGGLARLWEDGAGPAPAPAARLDGETGYGVAAFAGTLTPYGGVGLSGDGGRDLRLGVRFLRGSGFEMALEGGRRAGRAERAGHGLMLRGRMRW